MNAKNAILITPKKVLSALLLSLALVVGLSPVIAGAAGENKAKIVGGGEYATVQAAIEAAAAGQTVQMIADSTENVTVAEGQTVTLDLNGHVLTGGSTGSAIANYGTLTVADGSEGVEHYYTVGSDGLWALNTEATEGTAYETLTERPETGTVIAIKGGAITGGAKGTLIDGDKYGCGYTIAVGGGIYSKGDLTIDGAVICGNTINNTSGGDYMGIGVFCEGENCSLKNGAIVCGNACNVGDCNPRGGAVFSAATISAEDSSLSFNTISFTGGAIMSRCKQVKTGYYATLSMKNCSLLGNSAYSGGAVCLIGDEDNPEKTVFTLESCTLDNNVAKADGGAIDITYGKLNITGGSVSNNTCVFDGVYAGSGAAIRDEADTTLKDVVISGNSAARGGAIWLNQYSLTAENVTFTKNKATGLEADSNGGAIYVRSDNSLGCITLTNCEISENSAGINGGGICLMNKSEAEITGGKIADNTAGNIGGGLYVDSAIYTSSVASGKATLRGVEVSGNKAASGGGVWMNQSAQLLMDGCTVTGNSATNGSGGGIYKSGEKQKNKEEWQEKVVLLNTNISGNTASANGGGVYFKVTEYESNCFAKGTLITMADGTTKKVEDVVEGDMLKTFDHEAGEFSSAPVYLAWQKENVGNVSTFKLNFEGGSSVQCIGAHDFLEQSSRKYQTLTAENAGSYVGKFFFGEDGQWHELLSVSLEAAGDKSYCIYTAKHQNAFAGGMLSAPDDVDYLLNIYELDENLKADEAQLAADIEAYGLTSFEYASEVADGLTQEWYEAAGTKYLFVAIGKGFVTEEYAKALYAKTADDEASASAVAGAASAVSALGAELKTAVSPLLAAFAPVKAYAAEAPKLSDFDSCYLYVGTGTTVTDNTVDSKQNNVYLEPSQKKSGTYDPWVKIDSLIRVCDGATDMNIGVSVAEAPTAEAAVPVTTAENSVDYSEYFTSDNTDYRAYNRGLSSTQQIAIGNEVAMITETGIAYGTVQAAVNAAATGQTVKMIANSTENVQVGTNTDRSKVVTLDLNGKTLTSTGTVEGIRYNAITNYATLTIADSSQDGTGKITGGTGSAKGKGSYGGGVYNSEGTLTMTGGTITGNTAGIGGGVANIKGTFTMTGGSITGNTSTGIGGGGVVNLDGGTFIMTGGSITGNTAAGTGGGVYNDGTMKVSGKAQVTGNTKGTGESATANNVYLISGKAITVGTGSGESVKYLEEGAAFGVTTAETPAAAAPVAVTTAENAADYSGYFASDNAAYIAFNTGTSDVQQVVLGIPAAKVVETDKTYGTIQAAIDAVKDQGYTVQMLADSTENLSIWQDEVGCKVVLDLNGHILKASDTSAPVITIFAELTIKDSDSTATHTGEYAELTGGLITGTTEGYAGIYNEGTLNMYAGTITGNAGSEAGGVYNSTGIFTMYGGSIINNSATGMEGGGGVQNDNEFTLVAGVISGNSYTVSFTDFGGGGGVFNSGTFTMQGGSITKNEAKRSFMGFAFGGGVNNNPSGTFTMTGGSITENAADVNGGGVVNNGTMNVSGKAQVTGNTKGSGETATVNNVYLPEGKTIGVGTGSGQSAKYLEKGAAFGVTTGATPTGTAPVDVTGENSKDYSGFFASDIADYSVVDVASETSHVVKLGVHEHSWTYELSEDGATITAACGGFGTCSLTDTSLTIVGPTDTTYDGTNKEASFGTAESFCGGDLPTISYEYRIAASKPYAVATDTKQVGYYKASFTVGSGEGAKTGYVEFAVTGKQLGITGTTVSDKVYDGNVGATVSADGTLTGVIEGDSVYIYGTAAVFEDQNVGAGKEVTVTYEIAGDDAGNYLAPADASLTASITPKKLVVSQVTFFGKTYDGTVGANVKINKVSGIVGADDVKVSVDSATFANKNVGKGKDITAVYAVSGDDAANYSAPDNDTGHGEIKAKSIAVEADDKTSYVGSTLETLTYTADSLCEGDTFTGALTTDADKDVVAEYDITQGNLAISDGNSGNNYAITFTAGTYTVTDKEVQTLTFEGVTGGAVAKTYGDASFTEAVSGAETTVTYESSDTTVATVDASTGEVTILKAGFTTITATAAETAVYAQGSASYGLTVAKAKVAVPTAATDLVYDGTEQTGVEEDDLYTLTGNTGTDAGSYSATATLASKDNYEWDLETATSDDQAVSWSIARATITVTPDDDQEKTYDGATATDITYTYSGAATGETPDFTGALALEDAATTVGTYEIVIGSLALADATGFKADNYELECAEDVEFAINAKQLTISDTTAADKAYDGTADASVTEGTLEGAVLGDDVSVAIESASFDDENAGDDKPVTVVYAISGEDADNYLVPDNDELRASITPKAVNVYADDQDSYVGSELCALTYVGDQLIGTDEYTGELATDADKDVAGVYDIMQGTLSAGSNYAITFTAGTYTVKSLEVQELTFAVSAVSKTYGDEPFTQAVSGAATTVTYESSDPTVAVVDPDTGEVTIVSAGTATITATAEETAEYAQGTASYTLTVAKIKVAVPVAVQGLVYNGQEQTGVAEGELYTLTGNAATDAGDHEATASLDEPANYEWDLETATSDDQLVSWSIAPKQAVITAQDKSMTLGQAVPELTATAEGLIGTDEVAYGFKEIDVTAVGVYGIKPYGDKAQGNYEVTYKDGALTVSSPEKDAPVVDTKAIKEIQAKYAADPAYAGKQLDVILRTDGEVAADSKTRIMAKANAENATFIDASLFLIVKEDGKQPVTKNIGDDNDKLIAATFAFDFSSKKNIKVLRDHEGVVDELTETANAAGEYVKYDKEAGTVTIVASKYSTYAVAYDNAAGPEPKPEPEPTPTPTPDPTPTPIPGTGDATPIVLLALIAAVAGSCVLFARKRRA